MGGVPTCAGTPYPVIACEVAACCPKRAPSVQVLSTASPVLERFGTRPLSPPTVRVGAENIVSHCQGNGIAPYSDPCVRRQPTRLLDGISIIGSLFWAGEGARKGLCLASAGSLFSLKFRS